MKIRASEGTRASDNLKTYTSHFVALVGVPDPCQLAEKPISEWQSSPTDASTDASTDAPRDGIKEVPCDTSDCNGEVNSEVKRAKRPRKEGRSVSLDEANPWIRRVYEMLRRADAATSVVHNLGRESENARES